MNPLSLNQDTDSWIRFVPNFTWTVWTLYSLSLLSIFGYLVFFSFLHSDKKNRYKYFWQLLQIVLNNHNDRNHTANVSFSLYTFFGVIGIWLFNVILCALINTDLVSFPKSSLSNSLAEYQRSSLQPCFCEGKLYKYENLYFLKCENKWKTFVLIHLL